MAGPGCPSAVVNQDGFAGDLIVFSDYNAAVAVSGVGPSYVLTGADVNVVFTAQMFAGEGTVMMYLNTAGAGYVYSDPIVLSLGAAQVTIPLQRFSFQGGSTGKIITGYMMVIFISGAYLSIDDIAIAGAVAGLANVPGMELASASNTPEASTWALMFIAMVILRRVRKVQRPVTQTRNA